MVSRNRQIVHQESLPTRQRIDPRERPRHRRWLIDTKTRLALAADVRGVLEDVKAAIVNDRLHPEVSESSRVEERGSIARVRCQCRKRQTWHPLVVFRCRVKCWID